MDQQYTYYSTNQNGSQNPYTQPEKKPENKVRMGMFGYPEAVPAEGSGEEEQTVGEREEKGRYDFGGERTGVSGVKERAVETDEKAEAVFVRTLGNVDLYQIVTAG